jgi:hypothetical protein
MGRIFVALAILVLPGSEYKVEVVKADLDFRVIVVRYPALADSSRPVMEVIGDPWCAPCNAAKEVLASSKDLPFDVKHVSASGISYQQDIPAFRWKTPSGKTYVLTGWYGISHLLGEFRKYK